MSSPMVDLPAPGRGAWLFDLDGCLVDSMSAASVRPLSHELLSAIRARGDLVSVWSAGGDSYARRVLDRVGLADLVASCHAKDRGPDGRWRLPGFCGPDRDLLCVDDQAEGVPAGISVIPVFPYLSDQPHDRAFAPILDLLAESAPTETLLTETLLTETRTEAP